MRSPIEVEAARRAFLATGALPAGAATDAIRPVVRASWERSRGHDVDPERIGGRYLGHRREPSVAGAEEVLDEFHIGNPGAGCSVALLDTTGVVRVRRDADPTLGRLLDGVLLVPGYDWSERAVGTTAASVALHDGVDAAVHGAEHYHGLLTCLSGAAAHVVGDSIVDPGGEPLGVLLVLVQTADGTALQLALARLLAAQVAERVAGEPHRRTTAILDRFRRRDGFGDWALATDGEFVLTDPVARHLDGADLRVLSDLALAGMALQDFAARHVDLPSGSCAQVLPEPVHRSGELIGCILHGGPAGDEHASTTPEAVRRQGSHVAPTVRRDYAEDLRSGDAHDHAEARIRANRELLTPFLRARHEVVASISQGRNHLLIGEPGVGKQTLALAEFRRAHPRGQVVVVDCAEMADEPGNTDPATRLAEPGDGRPRMVLLRHLGQLSPIGARRLDEILRPLVVLAVPPLVLGCVDTPAIDATRPYGLLLRHFHEVTRIPPLRYRHDEIGEIALSILRRHAARRSLRLSLQVIRVLEGYAWPGNINELTDVMRFVLARKPLGEVQAPDLPTLCFQGRSRRMSMLEAAQCDAIIAALYESNGNRYKAAAMLGIARSSLYRKIDAFGISYIA